MWVLCGIIRAPVGYKIYLQDLNMLEDSIKKGESQGTQQESKRYCCWSKYRCCFLFLLMATTLLLYSNNLSGLAKDWAPKWWKEYNQTAIQSTARETYNETITTLTVQTVSLINETTTTPTLQTISLTTEGKALIPTPVPYLSPGPYYVEYPHRYHFLVDEEEKCREKNLFLVLMVPVAPHNRAARDAVRNTWGKENMVLGKVVRLFFLLALPSGEGREKVQEEVLQESREQRDLLQSDFKDSYKNLTIKTMVMLEWLSSRCPNASYAMKIDSDMFLNVHNLVNMLLSAPKQNYMTGLVAKWGKVLRDHNSKWYLPREVFSEIYYPPYALGLGYVLSLDLPIKLVKASRQVKAVYIEDVYLGLCMMYLGIRPTDPPSGNLFNVFPVPYNRCSYSRLIATTTHSIIDQVRVWRELNKPGPYC